MPDLKSLNCDLHIHGPNSGGVSKYMSIPLLTEQAQLKGLDVLSTGDCLNKEWLQHLKNSLVEERGCLRADGGKTTFILGGELCDNQNVHQLFYLPDFGAVDLFREKLMSKGIKLDGKGYGRPWVKVSAEELARIVVEDCKGLIGPAHGFTPYYSIYAHNDSIQQCYGSMASEIKFLELGLSADSQIADLIESNHAVQYFSCSDAHSAWPDKMGREFMRLKMQQGNFEELKKAVNLEQGRRIEMNIGLDAREGKYHCTACSNCFAKYSLQDALRLKMKCAACHQPIKRGVRDRALQLHKPESKSKPAYRAAYQNTIPLAEIIQLGMNVENAHSKKVQTLWRTLVEQFESEISILLDVPLDELGKTNAMVATKIQAFRKGWVHYIAGGGGNYGVPIICDTEKEFNAKKIELKNKLDCASAFSGQKVLSEF